MCEVLGDYVVIQFFFTGVMIDNQCCSHVWGVMVNLFMKHFVIHKGESNLLYRIKFPNS